MALVARDPQHPAARCLAVLLPGRFDAPEQLLHEGVARDLQASGAPCDAVFVDLHYRYYGETDVGDALYEDILAPARARGYDELWLVGVSLGGLGALQVASEHPDAVDGIVLIAPYLGDERAIEPIAEAGGLARWEPPPEVAAQPRASDTYTPKLWAWLRGYAVDPAARPPLYVGWGERDPLAATDRLLGDALEPSHVLVAPGEHDWASWAPIWRELFRRAPIGRAAASR